MKIKTEYLSFQTQGELDIVNITDEVQNKIEKSEFCNGIVTIFVPGSTGGLTTIEFEPGLLIDFPNMLNRIVPGNISYEHEKKWHDGNGHSHVRASLIGPDITIPFMNRKLTLGLWQQIIFIELDIRSRTRNIVLQMLGD
jgi:secondary thiamine-phosphate synthase enzyme